MVGGRGQSLSLQPARAVRCSRLLFAIVSPTSPVHALKLASAVQRCIAICKNQYIFYRCRAQKLHTVRAGATRNHGGGPSTL